MNQTRNFARICQYEKITLHTCNIIRCRIIYGLCTNAVRRQLSYKSRQHKERTDDDYDSSL